MKASFLASSERTRQLGLWAGSILISLVVATLPAAAFLPRLYNRLFSTGLLTLVLFALGAAIVLHARFLVLARREHRETAKALTTTENEFEAIFDSALDALLIFDDRRICLEANPAALVLFGAGREELVGSSIHDFEQELDVLQGRRGETFG